VSAPRLLNADQAAEYLALKTRHALGRVPVRPLKIGALVRWDRRALDAWLDEIAGFTVSSPAGSLMAAGDDPEEALKGWLAEGGAGAAARST
jgi:predicted DNA-binding transcriptional regulator AlpA